MVSHSPETAGHTETRSVHTSCPCGAAFIHETYQIVNVATDPELAAELVRGELSSACCPGCGESTELRLPMVYHDPSVELCVLVMPETMRHAEIQARIDVLQTMGAADYPLPAYMRGFDVVYGASSLQALIQLAAKSRKDVDDADVVPSAAEIQRQQGLLEQRAEQLERREEELLAREEEVVGKQEDLVARRARLDRQQEELVKARTAIERERESLRALSLDLAGKRRTSPPPLPGASSSPAEPETSKPVEQRPASLEGRPQEELDSWRASDEPCAWFLHQERVILTAKPGEDLQRYRDQQPTVLIQLQQAEDLLLPTVVVSPRDEGEPAALRWPLDPTSEKERALLEQLAKAFVVQLDLYDDERRPAAAWQLTVPLEENVLVIVERSQQQETVLSADRVAIAKRSIAEREAAELLGRKQHNFSAESFTDLPSPSAARLALGIVTYWSEDGNEDYLLLTKAFPIQQWRAIQQRVVQRAQAFGLRLSDSLTALALQNNLASTEAELSRKAVSNFAEVSLGLKANDLDPIQEWGNWKALLDDCVQRGVDVEQPIEALAAGAARRAQEWGAAMVDESEPGGDLSMLTDAQLLPLLTDRSQRRDAAIELCERGDSSNARPVFASVRNMTRAEVARVIPAMIGFGEHAVPLFVQGLRHHKSFIRQGCALALGATNNTSGIAPLIEMLLTEPTRIWLEAARALGDIKHNVLEALAEASARVDGEGRERIAWAMSHRALGPIGREAVEQLTKSSNPAIGKVARRAIEVLAEVRRTDAEVRGASPMREQTIVRSFSRRFFESMGGEVNELTEDDIVEQEEVLGDADILDSVEVNDEDILEHR